MFPWIACGLLLAVLVLQLRHGRQLRCLMATAAELNAKLDTIIANVAEIGDDLQEVIDSLPAEGGLTAEETAALAARLDGVVAQTRAVADVVPEAEPPTPES